MERRAVEFGRWMGEGCPEGVSVTLPANYFEDQPGDAEKIASVRARIIPTKA